MTQVPSPSETAGLAVSVPSYYQRHIFFCLNERKSGEEACANHRAQQAFERCKSQVKAAGLTGPGQVRVNKAGCYVDEQDIDEIVESHLKNGQVVERLLTPPHLGR